LTKIRTYGSIARMRHGGKGRRRIPVDAASAGRAGAAGGKQSPARAIGYIPLTFIPLTFSCFSILHPPSSFWSQANPNGQFE
jgi:hypothetical protein